MNHPDVFAVIDRPLSPDEMAHMREFGRAVHG